MATLQIPKDFECSLPLDAAVSWIHRHAAGAEIYFVANRTDRAVDLPARFRVAGREAELWHSDTGAIEPAEYAIAEGRTTVPLHLAERESVFVVFRRPTSTMVRTLPHTVTSVLANLDGAWDIAFPRGLGAPPSIHLDALAPWTANTNPGVKYFSGTATYSRIVNVSQSQLHDGARLMLDLGAVRDLAEISVNGRILGTLWKPPYEIDVTDALKPGANEIRVRVTDEWTNRIMGDRAGPPEQRVLALNGAAGGGRGGFGGAAQALPESGLMGPVKVLSVQTE